uniref:Uncharacterized protein n=1 Tax=Rhizophora mucronata TaxID=61149 RepID=A0A2P2NG07_RHIMU
MLQYLRSSATLNIVTENDMFEVYRILKPLVCCFIV